MGQEMSLGDRMKSYYEDRFRTKLTRRIPVIMRLDGKAFHTLLKTFSAYDDTFYNCMRDTTLRLLSEIQGVKGAYIQSDEISILITDYDTLATEAWFDYNIQKMCSVSASFASVTFTTKWFSYGYVDVGIFDCRVFNLPKEEVCNYFIWRQQDWIKNSVQMLARTVFSHKQLHEKSCASMLNMLEEKGLFWDKLESKWKNGTFIRKIGGNWLPSTVIQFTKNREEIENLL